MAIPGTPFSDGIPGTGIPLIGTAFGEVLNSNWSGGDDWMFGGAGNDAYNVNSAGDRVFEAVGGGIDRVNSHISYTLGSEVENLTLLAPAFNGNGTGNGLNNVITGNNPINTLRGLAGNDTLYGQGGNDTLVGGAGADTLNGGTGTDTLSYRGSIAAVTVNLATSTASDGDATGDTIAPDTFENLTGSSNSDNLTGSAGNNIIDAGNGNDTVDGGEGDDLIYLGDGDDYLNIISLGNDIFHGGNGNDYIYGYMGNEVYYGEAGNDTLLGHFGNDTLVGGAGADSLTGGDGFTGDVEADTYRYCAITESGVGVALRDVITDFTHYIDKIDLSAIDANITLPGNQAFEFRGLGGFNGGGDVNYFVSGADIIVQVEIEGDGNNLDPDMQIQLLGAAGGGITAADFIL